MFKHLVSQFTRGFLTFRSLPDEVGSHTINNSGAALLFGRFVIAPIVTRRIDRSKLPNIQLCFSDIRTRSIVFFIFGPPWERFSYRKSEGESRVAFALFGIRWYFA